MKTAVLLFAAAGVALAQLEGVPECAVPCIISAVEAVGCALTDQNCQCVASATEIGSAAAPCVLGACTVPADLTSAISAGAALCSEYLATATAEPTAEPTTEESAAPSTSVPEVPSTASITPPISSSPSGAPIPSGNNTISISSPSPPSPISSSSTAGGAGVMVTPIAMLLGALGAVAL